MVQGKFKKAKLPAAVQKKQKQKNANAFTRRSNAPIQPKKAKFSENQKIKQVISKSLNKNVESELRSRATQGKINLSKAQEAVAKHHSTAAVATATATTAATSSSSSTAMAE